MTFAFARLRVAAACVAVFLGASAHAHRQAQYAAQIPRKSRVKAGLNVDPATAAGLVRQLLSRTTSGQRLWV